jgi:hypothetical protein
MNSRSHSRKLALLCACAAMLNGCARATPEPTVRQQSWEEFQRDRPDTFIASYRESIDQQSATLRAAGLGPELDAVTAQVDAHLPPGNYTLQASGANSAVLRQLRVESTANYLVRQGYRAKNFSTPAQAKLLVAAAAGTLGGPTREEDPALFAPVVARVAFVEVESNADAARKLVVRVIEPLKNAPPKGALLRFALDAGQPAGYLPTPNPMQDQQLRPGEMVMFLAPAGDGAASDADKFRRFTQPMRLDGERLMPGYHADVPETTLPRLRAALKQQVCAPGFVPVAGGGGHSLPCSGD